MSLVPSDYELLIQKLTAFLSNVTFITQSTIDGANQLIKLFLESIEIPTPIPTPTPTPPPVTTPPNPVDPSDPTVPGVPIKFHEFIETLNQADFSTGGHRHRNYKGTLMHWIVPNRWSWQKANGKILKYNWKPSGWNNTHVSNGHSVTNFHALANQHKLAIGAFQVREFVKSPGIVQERRNIYFLTHH